MKNQLFLATFLSLISWPLMAKNPVPVATPSIEHGRYMVKVSSCNDCHTPMYAPRNGEVPENQWLIGDSVGWKGPWGTSYPSNLRRIAANMKENDWVSYIRNLRSRPPMPYFGVNQMTDVDLRSIFRYIRSLGDHPNKVPVALAPNVEPSTPYINMDVILPAKMKTAAKGH